MGNEKHETEDCDLPDIFPPRQNRSNADSPIQISSDEEDTQNYSLDVNTSNDCLIVDSSGGIVRGSPDLPQGANAPVATTSVYEEALHVAEVLGIDDIAALQKKLMATSAPNRAEAVINDILENGLKPSTPVQESISHGAADHEPQPSCSNARLYTDALAELASKSQELQLPPLSSPDSRPKDGWDWDEEEPPAKRRRGTAGLLPSPGAGPSTVPQAQDPVVPTVVDGLRQVGSSAGDKNETLKEAVHAAEEADDTLMKDLALISSVFPKEDRNEIYAYLEAHFDEPDRVQVVINELLQMGRGQEEGPSNGPAEATPSPRTEAPPIGSGASSDVEADNGSAQREFETVKALFPDCDPEYIREELRTRSGDEQALNRLITRMFEMKNYPKLRDRLEKERKLKRKQELQSLNFDLEEFLETYPDPKTFFHDEGRKVTENYTVHAEIHLMNLFPMLRSGYIKQILARHRSHFLPALRDLQKIKDRYTADPAQCQSMHKRFRPSMRAAQPMPDDCDELFYKELMYSQKEDEVLGLIQLRKDRRQRRIEAARAARELHECGCCYEEELLEEDILHCPKGHTFCYDCVRRSSEVVLGGQGRTHFPCLAGDCSSCFALPTLKRALRPKTFDLLLRRMQEEEIEQAGLEDLVKCPFCTFATIMPNKDDRVLCCRNPDCMRESCRLCREPNHVPLRCEEVERQGETDWRTFVEMRVSEAMLRTCYNCKKRFYKVEGCNKMTCSCGAIMCYVCRMPISADYSHYRTSKCPQFSDVNKLHQEEMKKALEEAKKKYKIDHPEAAEAELKFDAQKLIESNNNGEARQAPNIELELPCVILEDAFRDDEGAPGVPPMARMMNLQFIGFGHNARRAFARQLAAAFRQQGIFGPQHRPRQQEHLQQGAQPQQQGAQPQQIGAQPQQQGAQAQQQGAQAQQQGTQPQQQGAQPQQMGAQTLQQGAQPQQMGAQLQQQGAQAQQMGAQPQQQGAQPQQMGTQPQQQDRQPLPRGGQPNWWVSRSQCVLDEQRRQRWQLRQGAQPQQGAYNQLGALLQQDVRNQQPRVREQQRERYQILRNLACGLPEPQEPLRQEAQPRQQGTHAQLGTLLQQGMRNQQSPVQEQLRERYQRILRNLTRGLPEFQAPLRQEAQPRQQGAQPQQQGMQPQQQGAPAQLGAQTHQQGAQPQQQGAPAQLGAQTHQQGAQPQQQGAPAQLGAQLQGQVVQNQQPRGQEQQQGAQQQQLNVQQQREELRQIARQLSRLNRARHESHSLFKKK